MSPRRNSERLQDIKDALQTIQGHMALPGTHPGGPYEQMLHDSLLFQLIVIGEAVKNLTPALTSREPAVPWSEIAGQRDYIAHVYFRISMNMIKQTIQKDLPPLEAAIDRLIALPDLAQIDALADKHRSIEDEADTSLDP